MTLNRTDALLSLEHASCRLAGREIVHDVSLTVGRGEVLGLLGVNGAGKSTSLRMMAGLLTPTTGSVRLEGVDLRDQPRRARNDIGYLPEEPPLYPELRVDEYLGFCARLHGLAGPSAVIATRRVIERCELGAARERLIGVLSRGFRQRVGLAQAIIHEPALIILDEPASGLDPVQALKLRELIAALREHAVVVSTHVLGDVEACCDRVAILHQGELRHEGALSQEVSASRFRIGLEREPTDAQWRALPMLRSVTRLAADHRWCIELDDGAGIDALVRALVERDFGLIELREERAPLAETFLRIAATDMHDAAA